MRTEKILVTGACGQIGTELVPALRARYGPGNVIASDRHLVTADLIRDGLYVKADVMNPVMLERVVNHSAITQIYHLAAVLSANGEQNPRQSWDLNMQSLLNVLEAARKRKNCRVFWPSSIAVFGRHCPPDFCAQHAPNQPATVYGISKAAGELWCQYYYDQYGLDVRSIRYPGLVSHSAKAGGGTTDYAVDIFHQAIASGHYQCFLAENTLLPMLYMPDAIRAALELMAAPGADLSVRTSYNLWGITFSPKELAAQIRQYLPGFNISYAPDFRQRIADSWPASMNGHQGSKDWNWKYEFGLPDMTADMLWHLGDDQLKQRITETRAGLADVPQPAGHEQWL
jgi:nucleoside-diphosphate-sugar epimerase